MTAAEMEAIIGGYHGDAFSVLGPHPINTDKNQPRSAGSAAPGWTIRAFLPQAASASVLLDGDAIPMQKCDPERLLHRRRLTTNPAPTALKSRAGTVERR